MLSAPISGVEIYVNTLFLTYYYNSDQVSVKCTIPGVKRYVNTLFTTYYYKGDQVSVKCTNTKSGDICKYSVYYLLL